jgi:5-epi-alpha-selinene synthase
MRYFLEGRHPLMFELDATLRLPLLSCPFPAALHRDAALIDRTTVAWAQQQQLVETDTAVQRLQAVKIGWLMARVYPTVNEPILQLLADWTTWGFLWDDHCSEVYAADPDYLRQMHAHFLAILNGGTPPRASGSFGHALVDIRARILPRLSTAAFQRFVASVEQFFHACVWEATNRATGTVPEIATYLHMRPLSSGVYTYLELLPLISGRDLPEILHHPKIQTLTEHAINAVCWINDVFSLSKELHHQDVHNLVVLLAAHHGISLQAAVDRVAALFNAEVQAFLDLHLQLPQWSGIAGPALTTYVALLQSWMRGSLDWSYTSGRYLRGDLEMTV